MANLVQIELPNNREILAEVASSAEEQRIGMLKHDSIEGKPAMLFPYTNPTDVVFHTVGMKFGIDIVMLERIGERELQGQADNGTEENLSEPTKIYFLGFPPIEFGGGEPIVEPPPMPEASDVMELGESIYEQFGQPPAGGGNQPALSNLTGRRAMMDLSSFSTEELQEALRAMEELGEDYSDGLTYQEILDELHRRIEKEI
jgi:hypothetical protein